MSQPTPEKSTSSSQSPFSKSQSAVSAFVTTFKAQLPTEETDNAYSDLFSREEIKNFSVTDNADVYLKMELSSLFNDNSLCPLQKSYFIYFVFRLSNDLNLPSRFLVTFMSLGGMGKHPRLQANTSV